MGEAGGAVLSQGKPAGYGWGILSRLGLSGGESPRQGEGRDGRTEPAQATAAGRGPEDQKPTFLRGIANKAQADKRHRCRELDRCGEAELWLDGWQDLHKEAARGVDHVTAAAYAAHLPGNIEALVQRLKTKRSRAKLGRRCSMPKANGTAPRHARSGRQPGAPGLREAVNGNLRAGLSGLS